MIYVTKRKIPLWLLSGLIASSIFLFVTFLDFWLFCKFGSHHGEGCGYFLIFTSLPILLFVTNNFPSSDLSWFFWTVILTTPIYFLLGALIGKSILIFQKHSTPLENIKQSSLPLEDTEPVVTTQNNESPFKEFLTFPLNILSSVFFTIFGFILIIIVVTTPPHPQNTHIFPFFFIGVFFIYICNFALFVAFLNQIAKNPTLNNLISISYFVSLVFLIYYMQTHQTQLETFFGTQP